MISFPRFPFPGEKGTFVPLRVVKNIGKRIFEAGKAFFGTLFNGNEVREQKSFNEEKAQVDDIYNLNSLLGEYRQKVKSEMGSLEKEIQQICREVFLAIVETLEFANESFQFYKTTSIQRRIDNFLESLDGIFELHTAKRISLDDVECLSILKMVAGDNKANKMSELKKKVFQETIEDINKKLNEFMNDFFDSMELSVDTRMASIEERLEEKTESFEQLTKVNNEHDDRFEKIMMNANYRLYVAEKVVELIDSEVK